MITNAALIVFREGLEAILIIAAITASMVGGEPPPSPPGLPRRAPGPPGHGGALGPRPDRDRLPVAVRREARGGGGADRDRGALTGAQLVLPPRLLDRLDRGTPQARQGPGRDGHRGHGHRGLHRRRPLPARVLERLSRGLRDGPVPPGARPGGGDRGGAGRGWARPGGDRRRRRAHLRPRAAPALQADADRHRGADLAGARGHGRQYRPDAAGGRLAADYPARHRATAVDGNLARDLSDRGVPRGTGRRLRLRHRQLLPRRVGAKAPPAPHPSCETLPTRAPRAGPDPPEREAEPVPSAPPEKSPPARERVPAPGR